MNRCLLVAHVPEWMTKVKISLIQKDPLKGTAPNNYGHITCQPMKWKILTVQITEEIYYSLTSHGLFLRNRKDSTKGPEAQESYFIQISTSSTRARPGRKI